MEPSFTDSVFRFRFCFRFCFRFRDSVSVSVSWFRIPDSGFRVLVLPVSMKVKFCSRDTSHWFIFWSRALFEKPASQHTLHLLCRPMVRRGPAATQAISGDKQGTAELFVISLQLNFSVDSTNRLRFDCKITPLHICFATYMPHTKVLKTPRSAAEQPCFTRFVAGSEHRIWRVDRSSLYSILQ